MTTLLTAVPVLASLDIEKSAAFYERKLGFERGAIFPNYAVMRRDGVEIHFWKCDDRHLAENTSCRVNVRGIEGLHSECKAHGILHPNAPLTDQPWGLREFGVVDLDGNLIKFAERRTDRSARDSFEKYGAEINAHDFDRLAPLISADCTFWFSSGTHRGLDEARRAFERTWAAIQQEVYSVSAVEWIAESDRAAACTYTFRWEGVVKGERREGRGRGTTCLRPEPDGWKIVHEHLSPFPA